MKKLLLLIALFTLTINVYAQSKNDDNVGGYPNGLAITTKEGLYGFKDKNGKEVITPIYRNAKPFNEGLAAVRSNKTGLWGFINTNGEVVIDFKYTSVGQRYDFPYKSFEDGYMFVEIRGENRKLLTGLIDKKGNVVIPFSDRYYAIYKFVEGMAKVSVDVKKDDPNNIRPVLKYGFVNKSGKETVLPIYDDVESFSEGLALVKINKKEKYQTDQYGFVNTEGKVVIPIEYDEANSFSEGVAYVKKVFKTYFIDQNNKTVLKTKYTLGKESSFKNGLCRVADVNSKNLIIKYGFINNSGKLVIPIEYEDAGSFDSGVANVKKNDFYGIINTKGQVIHPFKFPYLSQFHDGIAKYRNEDSGYSTEKEFGFINHEGTKITPVAYKGIYNFENGKVWVRDADHKWISIDKKGNQL